MTHLIDKDVVLAKIDERIKERNKVFNSNEHSSLSYAVAYNEDCFLKEMINSLEVNEVDNWHLQSKEDIDNVLVDWGLHTFVCIMKDGTIQKFSGIQAECYDGTINKHLDCADDNYEWEYDDIIYWIEVPNIKAQKGE